MTTKRTPAHTIRVGRVKAAIWANETEKHGALYNVTVSRTYRVGDTFKGTSSFGRNDLPLVCKALDQAHTWILQLPQKKAE